MSVLADIYVSSDDEAVRYDSEPEQFAERVQFRRITSLELSVLWSIICKVEWDVTSMDEFLCLLQIDEGERLVHRVPASMISELATMSPHRIASIASAWAATEELNCNPEEIRPFIDALVGLARRANETGQGVFLWNCV